MLSNFFRINLPYGISKNDDGAWMAFNREYMPLGFGIKNQEDQIDNDNMNYPVYTKYKNIREATLIKLAFGPEGTHKDKNGKIVRVFFYNDRTNPSNDPSYWDKYMEKIKLVSKFSR